jgi:beta-hydroxylase
MPPLADHGQAIRDEAVRLDDQGAIKASDPHDDAGFNSFFKTGSKRWCRKWRRCGGPLVWRLLS